MAVDAFKPTSLIYRGLAHIQMMHQALPLIAVVSSSGRLTKATVTQGRPSVIKAEGQSMPPRAESGGLFPRGQRRLLVCSPGGEGSHFKCCERFFSPLGVCSDQCDESE